MHAEMFVRPTHLSGPDVSWSYSCHESWNEMISTFRNDFQVAAELVKSLSPAIPFLLEMAASAYRHTKINVK